MIQVVPTLKPLPVQAALPVMLIVALKNFQLPI